MIFPVGNTVRFDQMRDEILRGDDFRLEFDVNEDAGQGCGAVVVGDPVDGRFYSAVASARVLGTNEQIPVTVYRTREGNETTPVRIYCRVAKENAEKVFAEGAYEAFLIRVALYRAPDTFTVLAGEVTVTDTAAGGFAA